MTHVKNAPIRPAIRKYTHPRLGWIQSPKVNVIETNDEFQIHLAVPGLSKSQIDIKVEDDQIRISAATSKDEKINYLRKEFDYSKFEKVFDLPESIDQSKVEAKLNNGILHVTLAKKEEAKKLPPQSIKIK